MTNHTPGPWRHDARNHQIRTGLPSPGKRFSGECIASVGNLPEMQASARLIAAAPDLLDALKDIVKAYRAARVELGYDDDGESESIELAEAAIAKVEGR